MNDLKFAFRQLLKNPGFTAMAVLSLAIGAGGSMAMFSIVNAFILNPVPGEEGNRVVEVRGVQPAAGAIMRGSPAFIELLHSNREVFQAVGAYEDEFLKYQGEMFVETLNGCKITPDLLDLLGATPHLGRAFASSPADGLSESEILISHEFWQTKFGGDPDVLGRTIRLGEEHCMVVGVMPQEFGFPHRVKRFWRPLHFTARELNSHTYQQFTTLAKLAPGVTQRQAQAFLDQLYARLQHEHPNAYPKGWFLRLRPLSELLAGEAIQQTLWSLLAAMVMVLMLTGANLANLQLIRAEERQKEFAVRLALGAGRKRLFVQVFAESALVTLIAGAIGLLIARWGAELLIKLLPWFSASVREPGFDWRIFGFGLLLLLTVAVVIGVYPALQALRINLNQSLKESGLGLTVSAGRKRFRQGLVVVQTALALVLVCATGLMIQSMLAVLRVNPGYDTAGLMRIQVSLPRDMYATAEKRRLAVEQLAEMFRSLPSTESVGFGGSEFGAFYQAEGTTEAVHLAQDGVGTGDNDFFRAAGVRLLEGRWFGPADGHSGQNTVLVNESLARLCWPGSSAVGKQFARKDKPDERRVVIGVVPDLLFFSYEQESRPAFYVPCERDGSYGYVPFYLRSQLDSTSLVSSVREVVSRTVIGSTAPMIEAMDQRLYNSTRSRRLYTKLLIAFGVLGLSLAALGVYGVVSCLVLRRTKELAIRMAVGASRSNLAKLVLLQATHLILVGTGLGVLGVLAVQRVIQSQLFGISALNPVVLCLSITVLIASGLAASALPAWRAGRIDPVKSLRTE